MKAHEPHDSSGLSAGEFGTPIGGATRFVQENAAAGPRDAVEASADWRDTEARLRHSLEQHQAIFDTSLVGIMVLENRIITHVNERMAAMLGFTVEELVGKGPQQVHLSRENYEEFGEKYYWRLADQEIVQIEYPLRHKNGHAVWCVFNGRAIAPPDLGKGAVWIIDDISQRKAIENELREKTALQSTVFDGIPDIMVLQDTDHRVLYFNRAALDAAGESQARVVGRKCYELQGLSKQCDHCVVERARMTGQIQTGERHWQHVGRDFEVRAFPIKNSQGEVVQLVEILRDVTEQKAADNQLRAAREDLEQYVVALESSNAALAEISAKAEAATLAKSEFLANMSHEIRTPMTAILGFAELLLENGVIDEDQAEALAIIRSNGRYLLDLINEILDLSKIEAGKLEMERSRCSPALVLLEVASLMRVRAEAKGIKLGVSQKTPIPKWIECDATRLRQILINLAGNAVKFTEIGGVDMSITLVEGVGTRSRIRFDVTDSGIGMTKEQVSKLFQPFVQADSSTTREYGGTGLGLTISKRLAEMLGGNITVESWPDAGSVFTLTVDAGVVDRSQMVEDMTAALTDAAPPSPASAPSRVVLDSRILLAEDGPDNRRLISLLLKKAGATVELAENGKEACEKALAAAARGEPFDVVLMDMQMPVMDGYEATRRLREANYEGPILSLTAHAMEGDKAQCLSAGCDGYLTKPIERERFLATVADWAARNHSSSVAGPRARFVAIDEFHNRPVELSRCGDLPNGGQQ